MKNDLRKALRKITEPPEGIHSLLCTVDEIDMDLLECYCVPVNGDADIQSVKLIASNVTGFIMIPALNSEVIVSFMSDSSAFISMFSEVEDILLNGENYGGVPKVTPLVTKLNNLESKVNSLLTVFTSWVPVASDGGAALKALLIPPVTTPLTATAVADLENATVKHGNGS